MNEENQLEMVSIEDMVGARSRILNHDSIATALRRAVEVT